MKKTNLLTQVLTLLFIAVMLTDFASAQGLGALATTLGTFNTALIGLGAAVIVTAIIWAGFKVMFGAGWADVANAVWGAIIVGGATLIGGLILKGTAAAGGGGGAII